MSSSFVLTLAALVASLFLIGSTKSRGLAIGAAVISGVALAMSVGVLRLSVPYLSLGMAVGLAVLGGLLLARVERKVRVVSATVVLAVGVFWLAQELL